MKAALGAVVLVLTSWGCGGQRVGGRALPPLPLGVTARVSELPYIVMGTTVPEIRTSLRTAATEVLKSSHVDSHRARLDLSYRYGLQGVHCKMTWIAMEVESVIQVPRWTDREAADSTLVAMWDTYIAALRGHEHTHREYLYRRATDISRELYRIESPTCASMQEMANSTAARINDRYWRLNEQFDEDSGPITWPPMQ